MALVGAVVAATVSLGSCSQGEPRPAAESGLFRDANLVLIMIDTLRADHCTFHGYQRPTTPYLERLAAHSYVFETCLTNASWTRPSIASFLTGRLPDSHGAVTRKGSIDRSVETLAEILKQAGYTTVGWWGNPNVHPGYGFDQGFDRYEKYPRKEIAPGEGPVATADGLTPLAIAWLKSRARAKPGNPFLLYLHYMDPHEPYFYHPEHDFNPDYTGDAWGAVSWLHAQRIDNERDRSHIRALYDGEIAFVDASIGQLLQQLERLRQLRNTIVVVTADHGEGLWSHRTRDHGHEVYEEQIRVPLVIKLPGHQGRRVSGLVESIDLLPTIAELLGLETPEGVEGTSLVALVRGETAESSPVMVHEELDGHHLAALRAEQLKVIINLKRLHQLSAAGKSTQQAVEYYDLVHDPGEKRPISFEAAGPEAHELHHELLRRLQNLPARSEDGGEEPLDPEIEESLRALGYIDR
jgi:arylsulfatase A-like enzyme